MTFIDTGVSGYGGLNPGSPSGGGVNVNANVSGKVNVAPGAGGFGSSMSIKGWTIIYLAVIIAILVMTGILFNGKGRG